jgi:curved DNA-binding protein CbpA
MAAAAPPVAPSPPSPPVQPRVVPVEARPVPDPSPVPAPAVGGDPALRAEIVSVAERLESLDHYEVLGVTKEDGPSIVQGAFFQLAKKWHPDRIGSELSDLRDLAARVFARMSEAHQTLSSPELRAEYDKSRASPAGDDGEQAVVQKVLLAATAFQKAEILLRRGQTDAAETELKLAVDNDPDQAEYAALYADLLSQKLEREPNANHAPYVQAVNEARKREPQNRKVRLYRARVLRRSGDMDGAVREWRAIIELDPGNVEAARELRLFEMRRPRKKQESKPDLGGAAAGKDIGQFFNKLFKR